MGFNDILKKLFGNKSQRDLREIQPYVDRILAEYAKIESLDNDELRRRVRRTRKYVGRGRQNRENHSRQI